LLQVTKDECGTEGPPSVTGRRPLLLGTTERLVSPLLSLVSSFKRSAKQAINRLK
jgi:hypothetical protein